MTHPTCIFCAIARGEAPAEVAERWPGVLAIVPLNPVTPGHVIVLPTVHVMSAISEPALTGYVMTCAALYAKRNTGSANLITSIGIAATQTVWHLHIHIVPRHAGDSLALPWTGQGRVDS